MGRAVERVIPILSSVAVKGELPRVVVEESKDGESCGAACCTISGVDIVRAASKDNGGGGGDAKEEDAMVAVDDVLLSSSW
jgi:hypothetical protein